MSEQKEYKANNGNSYRVNPDGTLILTRFEPDSFLNNVYGEPVKKTWESDYSIKTNPVIQTKETELKDETSNTVPSVSLRKGFDYTISPEGVIKVLPHVQVITGFQSKILSNKNIKRVIIPDTVTRIENWAFAYCHSLTSVTFLGNSKCKSIGNRAFSGCKNLTNLIIPGSVTEIGDGAFSDCSSLLRAAIPNSVTSIGKWAFAYCHKLKDVQIPDGVECIGDYAFYNCRGLKSVVIGDDVKTVGDYAFYGCESLTHITLPKGLTEVGKGAFVFSGGLTLVIGESDQEE